MAVYEQVRHQQNIIWTSEAYFFGDGPVHILPYDPQCHELFATYIFFMYHAWKGYLRKIPVEKRKISRAEWRGKFSLKTGIFRKYPSQT